MRDEKYLKTFQSETLYDRDFFGDNGLKKEYGLTKTFKDIHLGHGFQEVTDTSQRTEGVTNYHVGLHHGEL
jgi:hypothetical protein